MQNTPLPLCDLDGHVAWFDGFVQGYMTGAPEHDGHITLKHEHSRKVLAEAQKLCPALPVQLVDAALLAALYHDLGRFDQYKRYRTFKDPLSENHGVLGVKALRRTGVLGALSRAERSLVAGAVVLHNRKTVPGGVGDELRTVTSLVRDADKLDIVRIMLDHMRPGGKRSDVVTLHVADEPDRYSLEIVRDIEARRLGDYSMMRYVNDFCLLLVSWTYDLNFKAARRAFLNRGHLEELFALLPPTTELTRLKDRIYTDLVR